MKETHLKVEQHIGEVGLSPHLVICLLHHWGP